jgi:DNA-binding NarL/FixJ family response regulator
MGGLAVRVAVVEDGVLLRAGLVRLLQDAGHEVVAELDRADRLGPTVEESGAELVVLDVRLPPGFRDEGVRAAVDLRRSRPEVGVMLLSQYVEERHAVELLADDSGGIGYLLKERVADLDEFLAALERVGAGGSAFDPAVVRQLLSRSRGRDPIDRLTPREREVLELMAEGLSNPAIADRLVVSVKAVEKHIASIFGKLGLRPQAVGEDRRVRAVLMWLDRGEGGRSGA